MAEACERCGFFADDWDDQDTISTVTVLGPMVELAIERAPMSILKGRLDRRTWSILQYVDHLRLVTTAHRSLIEAAVSPTPAVRPTRLPAPMAPAKDDVALLLRALAAGIDDLHRVLTGLDPTKMEAIVRVGRADRSIRTLARNLVHEFLHHLADIAFVRHELGDIVKMRGRIAQISSSDGGVPKTRCETARVDRFGIVGDRQASRLHHGRPWQAMCLYSAELIDALGQEGHSIQPGSVGENLTLTAIDWSAMRAGLEVRIGGVLCVLSTPAIPCSQNDRWFADGRSNRIDHAEHPGWSRWYASVIKTGVIASGDEVVISSFRNRL